jgi:uncharacterized protein
MKLHLNQPSGRYSFSGYGEGYVEINGTRHASSLLITPNALYLDEWQQLDFSGLDEPHFERLARLKPEMVLLGTGMQQRFPHPRLSRALVQAGIGLDVMDTRAACRTYNILLAEDREVAALILL